MMEWVAELMPAASDNDNRRISFVNVANAAGLSSCLITSQRRPQRIVSGGEVAYRV